jgi:hypothetical protein
LARISAISCWFISVIPCLSFGAYMRGTRLLGGSRHR